MWCALARLDTPALIRERDPHAQPGKPGSGYFRMTFHDIHPL